MASTELSVLFTSKGDLQNDLAKLRKDLQGVQKDIKAATDAGDTGKVDQLSRDYANLSGKIDATRASLKRVNGEIKNTSNEGVKSTSKLEGAWKKLQKVTSNPLFTVVSAAAITMFAKSAIQSFAEVEDASSALQATFGESGDRMIAWANESALAFNLSRKEALGAAQTMAVFGDSAGLAGQDLEQFAISLTERAADAASFFGGSTADAITAFGAALRGETEPIRKYGVFLDDATLRAKAFEMGLVDTTSKALTPQVKTLAAYNVIMEQTTRVQGDVSRTQDSMANQIKQSQAQMENFKTTVGETLAVGLGPMLKALNSLMGAFNGLPQPIKSVAVGIAVFGAALLVIGPRIATMVVGMRAAGVEAVAMRGKMAATGSFLAGPWGAALAIASIALTHFVMEQGEANARVDEFSQNIDTVTGKLNAAGQTRVIDQLQTDISEEDWKALEQLGIGLDDAAAAAIHGGAAWDSFREKKAAAVNRAETGAQKELLATLEGNVMGLRKEVEDGTRKWEASVKTQALVERGFDDTSDAIGGVTRQLVRVNPPLGEYRDAAYSASYAASALKVANQRAADATSNLAGGLEALSGVISEQQAMASYQTALDEFIKNPSEETALAVSSAMTNAASAIQDPGKKAQFTQKAVTDIKTAASDAGMKLNPELEAGLDRAQGQAKLLETQIDRAVRARTVDITLRFNDSKTTYGGNSSSPTDNTPPWTGGYIQGPGTGTSDSIRTKISNGEFIMRAAAVKAIGVQNLNRMNRNKMVDPALLERAEVQGHSGPLIGQVVVNNPSENVDVEAAVATALRRAERRRKERG